MSSDKDKIAQYHVVEAIKRTEGIINKQIKLVTNNPKLNAEDKRQKIDQLNRQKDRLARRLKAT